MDLSQIAIMTMHSWLSENFIYDDSDCNSNLALIETVRQLPKVELHAHLTGCLRTASLVELLPHGIAKSCNIDDLRIDRPVDQYSSFFRPWQQFINHIPDTPEVAERLLREVGEDFSRDGVVYAEVRISLRRAALNGYLREYLTHLQKAQAHCRLNFGIELRIIGGVAVHQFTSTSKRAVTCVVSGILSECSNFPGLVVGFDAWGDQTVESNFNADDFLLKAKASGYRITVHLGEVDYALDLARIQRLHPDRVSHGPALSNNAELLRFLSSNNIMTEVCLTSNHLAAGSGAWQLDSLTGLIQAGAPVAFCADNTSVLSTTLTREICTALHMGVVSLAQLRQSLLDSPRFIFSDSTLQDRIRIAMTSPLVDDLWHRLDSLIRDSVVA